MAHILILRARQNNAMSEPMFRTAIDVISANGHTYDEILVPSIKELVIAINTFGESFNYEATICIGSIITNKFEDSKTHYQEVLRCLYDYSAYFGHLVGNCITIHDKPEADKAELSAYAQEIVSGVCEFIKVIREINSMDGSRYAGNIKHN
jgi:6,7-dimethyl-8-ribityllumazine synthase